MEQQGDYYCKKDKKRKCCIDLIIFIISILISFIIGLLIGSSTELVTTLGIGAIIAFLVTLIVLFAIRIITIVCSKKRCY